VSDRFISFSSGGNALRRADSAIGIAHEAHLVPPARERIEQHEPAGERLAHPGDELDRLHGLERPHDAHERREHAHGGAALFRRLRVLAAQVEYGDLAIETDARAGDERLA
jgi:hypothetical protein